MDALNSINNQINTKSTILKKQQETKKFQTEKNTNNISELPNGNVWKAMVLKPDSVQKANKLINKFALTGKLGINDIRNLKKAIRQGDSQAENISMLLTLVDEKSVNSRSLRYVCKNGIMSDEMEKDVRMIFNAKKQGINPKDALIPNVDSKEAGISSSQTGDLFEVEGEKGIYIKNKIGQAEQLKMDKETMFKLFPPAERFANSQTYSADCYFVSSVNSMIDNPNARTEFFKCFEQDGDNIKIKFPSSDFVYTAQKGEMPKAYKGNFVTGSLGMKLLEYAYGEFLTDKFTKQAKSMQNKAIDTMQQQLLQTQDPNEQKVLKEKISNYQKNLNRFEEDLSQKKPEYILELDDFRNPVMNESEGISLRSLNQMNMYRKTSFQTAGDYYRGDGGYMEDVFIDFGYKNTKAYSMEDEEIQQILKNPKSPEKYIFSGGTKHEGKTNFLRAELIMDRSLNMYGSHAYRIEPSSDKNGEIVYKVSNPWNSSQNSILTFEQMKQFFSEIHIAEIQ
ncbi:MAG: hypothetical protein ACI37T_00485 [Candidatus Gastranaerophilaceae bacterium]